MPTEAGTDMVTTPRPDIIKTGTNSLEEKILSRDAVVGIIGMGYVGLTLSFHIAEAGYTVIGYDVDPRRITSLKNGEDSVTGSQNELIKTLLSKHLLQPHSDSGSLSEADIIIISVPTPLTRNQIPDLSHINDASALAADHLKINMLMILESTTYPGCTRELMLPTLEQSGLKVGRDFWLAFSPERVDPGRGRDLKATPKLVGGITSGCSEIAALFYSQVFEDVIELSSTEVV